MSTGFEPGAAHTFLSGRASGFPWIQLHKGDPGAAGTANVATETDRVQASFAAPSGGSIATSADLLWTAVAAGEDYTHWSGWSLASGGAVGWSGTITADAVTAGNNFRILAGDLVYVINVMG